MNGRTLLPVAAAVVSLGKLRYLALTLPPFAAGVLGSPDHDARYLWAGGLAVVLLRVISSVANCLSDREEDAVDHPARVAMIDRAGYENVRAALVALVVAYVVVVIAMAAVLDVYLAAIVLWLAFLYLKLVYSFGPRLKPRRFSATILLGGVSGGMFFAGWIGAGPDDLVTAIAGGMLLWALGASLSGSKDAPNVQGDLSIGYRSVYLDVVQSGHPLRRAIVGVSRPYAAALLLAALTLGDGPGLTLLWCFAAYPVAIAFAVVLVRARTELELSLVREVGYIYWIVSMGAVLIGLVPEPAVVAMMAAALVWYVAVSRVVHPDPTPLDASGVRGVGRMLAGA